MQRQGVGRHLAHLAAQHGQDARVLFGQHAQRDDSVRPEGERAVLVPADGAVAAERERGGKQSLDQGLPLPHADTAVCEQRRAVFDERHVGRRAADIDDDCVVAPGQRAAAERGGSRAGEQGLDRVLRRIRQPHQAGIRAHDQDLRVNAAFAECACDRCNEILRDGQQTRVKHRARRALEAGKAGKQLAGAHHRQAGLFADDFRSLLFKHAAIAHAVDLADRAAFRIREPLAHVRAQLVPVRLLHDLSRDGGFAGQVTDIVRVGKTVVRTEAVDPLAVDAHKQQPRAAEFALYARIGGKRGGQPCDRGLAAQHGVEPVECRENTTRQVVIGGQRLVLAEHLSCVEIIKNGVRTGATRINADGRLHGNASFPKLLFPL